MKRNQSPWPTCLLFAAIGIAGILVSALTAHGQTPALAVTSSGSYLAVGTATPSPWKQFVVTAGSAGTYTVLWLSLIHI